MVKNAENLHEAEGEARPQDSEIVESVQAEEATQETQPTEAGEKPEGEQRVPLKQLVKERRKKQEAQSETERLKQELQAKEQELNLFKLATPKESEQAEEVLVAPNPNDFLDDSEWHEANQTYQTKLQERVRKESHSEVQKLLQQREQEAQTIAQQQEQQKAQEQAYENFLDEADKLGVDNFLELEEKIKGQVWSPQFYDQVISNVPNAALLIADLGNNTDKALELAQAVDNKGMKGMIELYEYAKSINPIKQSGESLPEPDEPIEGGAGGSALANYENELDRSRNQYLKDGNMDAHMVRTREIKRKYGR